MMVDVNLLISTLVFDESPLPSPLPSEPPIDPSRVTPGLLALVSVVFLVTAIVLLYRSMRKQIARRVHHFDAGGLAGRLIRRFHAFRHNRHPVSAARPFWHNINEDGG